MALAQPMMKVARSASLPPLGAAVAFRKAARRSTTRSGRGPSNDERIARLQLPRAVMSRKGDRKEKRKGEKMKIKEKSLN